MATLENVLSGAGTGAAIGSAVPVIGTAIGAGAGALVGGIGSLIQWYMSQGDDAATAQAKAQSIADMASRTRNNFQAGPAQIGPDFNFADPMNASIGNAAMGASRAFGAGDQQQALADALRAQAEGTAGPSLAQMQLQQATDRTGKQAAGMIGAQRGLSAGTAARLASNAAAGANQEAAGQAAMLRAQEQLAAQNALAAQIQAMRGGDIQQQQAAQGFFGQAGALRGDQRGQNMQNQLEAQRLNADVARGNQQAAMDAERVAAGQAEADAGRAERDQARTDRIIGGATNAAAGYAAMAGTVPGSTDVTLVTEGPSVGGLAEGGMVPGKARKRGDSTANDTVTAALSPGEIVIPRTIAQHPNPAMAGAFVEALRRRKPVAA